MVPLAPNVCKGVEEIGLSWFLESSSIDPACLVVAAARSAEGDWTSRDSFDTWIPYCWEAGNVFTLPEGHTTISCKRTFDGDVPRTPRVLLAGAVRFAVDRLISKDTASARLLRLMVLWVWPPVRWVVTSAKGSSLPIQMITMATIGTSLMCPLILTSRSFILASKNINALM